jgi:Na+/melibiose symporter-like transporter
LLDGSGFLANQEQGPQALAAIRMTMGLAPALGAALSFLVMRGYTLDDREHRRIVGALAQREAEAPGAH